MVALLLLTHQVLTAGPWCPLWHNMYQNTMYDPSAPIKLADGTWHMVILLSRWSPRYIPFGFIPGQAPVILFFAVEESVLGLCFRFRSFNTWLSLPFSPFPLLRQFPDGCGGWCHYSSPDLFHWSQHPPLPKLGAYLRQQHIASQ